ncbi:E1a-binding protein, partial [Globisporangium splendens]
MSEQQMVIVVVVFFLVHLDRRQLVEQRDALVATDHSVGIERKRAESGGEEDAEGVKEKTKKAANVEKRTDDDGMTATPETSRTHVMDVDTNGNAEITKSHVLDPSEKVNGVAASAAASSSVVEVGKSSGYANGGTADTIASREVADNVVVDGVIGSSRQGADIATTDTVAATPQKVTKHRAEVDSSLSAKHTKTSGGGDSNADRKKRSRENSAADATAILEKHPVAKRVVRTSTPSKRYLDGSQQRHPQEFSGSASMQPLPVNATGVNGHTADGGQFRMHRLSVEQVHGEFEKKLRDSVRLYKEVGSRSLSMTRKRQLPRLATPSRQKSHWDYLLEEMKWMATDFSHERNWKRVMQFHLAKDVIVAQNAEKVRQEKENHQLAREIALQVSAFWRTIERIAARSRVRFEAGGNGGMSSDDDTSAPAVDKSNMDIEAMDENVNKQASGSGETESKVELNYKKIEVLSGSPEERCVNRAKSVMKRIVATGQKARDAMLSKVRSGDLTPSTERALRDIETRSSSHGNGGRSPSTVLAAFQVLALRWMLELYGAGLNMLLNDQLGMGKAATISAFLSLVNRLQGHAESSPDASGKNGMIPGPHLIIVAEEELHKWQFALRIWRDEWKIQVYEGISHHRKQLQREWKTKPASGAAGDQFFNDSHGDELWNEDTQPVFCVLCPVRAFLEDSVDFVGFNGWQMLVVENEFDELFEDPKVIADLKSIQQKQRRILCNGRSIDNWSNVSVRNHYAEFLLKDCSAAESEEWSADAWSRLLQLDKPSVTHAMQACGKSSNAVTSLWKSVQQESPNHVGVIVVALYCLGLRRVRSEVEAQLGKIEEQSLSCMLGASQVAQYRTAISGFVSSISVTSEREERLEVWLQLFLRLRTICNCVDIVNDFDKLALADMRVMLSCSAKLDALSSLINRLVVKEEKRVVIYCQFNGMFPILEMFLTLLDVSFVRIAGKAEMQRRALSHFAERVAVKVALASTRLSCQQGTRAVTVYGADAIIVLDSDWSAICDAKLRASWAKMAVGRDVVPVYRLHCEQTIEASLLQVGACFSEKVFSEMTPQELLVVPSDLPVGSALEKPSWWTSNPSSGTAAASVIENIATSAQRAEDEENFCGDESELERPLLVYNIDLDAEEHLLLSNTDELTPVEWYAVNYVHGLTDKKRGNQSDDDAGNHDDELANDGWMNTYGQTNTRSFDKFATIENKQQWQNGDTQSQLFYDSSVSFGPVDEKTVEKLFDHLRVKGVEAHYDVYKPPQPPTDEQSEVFCDPGTDDGNQMLFHVSYRIPVPPAPAPTIKVKSEQASLAQSDVASKSIKVKKQRSSAGNAAAMTGAVRTGTVPPTAAVAGLKRKLDQQSGGTAGVRTPSTKEQRVDLEGIPLPDVAEFEDDDFWGDTNLDALDSASWDDASVLTGILGPTVESSSGVNSSSTAGTASTTQESASSGTKPVTKKAKGSTGTGTGTATNRARKGSVSSDSGRDGWSSQDDMVLRKLFELYGSNWTLIAQVFNSTTAVSRFFCKKRSPRQCYDRYGRIISGSLSSGSSTSTSSGSSGVKDGKSTKNSKSGGGGIHMLISPEMLDARIGLPADEMLLVFPTRNLLPGLPPPSIINVPNLVEMSMKKKKMQKQLPANSPGAGDAGGMDDLKSIRNSFDAIIQCMKRKTAPPPIPIPSASPPAATDFSTKASLTATGAASFSPSPASKAAKSGNVTQALTSKTVTTVSPPHKSHMDIISLLPNGAVGPDDVIKRSKEAAAVQAAAAVVSVGRDVSPLSAAGDAIIGAAFGSSAATARKAYATNMGGIGSAAGNNRGPGSGVVMAHGAPGTKVASSRTGSAVSAGTAATSSPAWGDMQGLHQVTRGVGGAMTAIDLNNSGVLGGVASGAGGLSVVGASGNGNNLSAGATGTRNTPMPVSTSTLLHVLDRMPEIKNKIQTILNRSDCSEAQKVTMIARLLSNTNAVASVTGTPPTSLAAPSVPSHQSNAVSVVSSSVMAMGGSETATSTASRSTPAVIDLDTPIPMPAGLASAPTPTPPSTHLPANAALLMESLSTSPVSTPPSFPPTSS